MWLDAEAIGVESVAGRTIASLVALTLAALAFVVARRSPAHRTAATAFGIGWLTSVPSAHTALATAHLVLGATLFGIAVVALRHRTGLRALRVLRVAAFRAGNRRFDLVVATLFFVLSLALSFALFDGIPVIQDSQAQLFHARILATGHFVALSPPGAEHFLADHMIVTPHWYSQYPPGHSLVLLLGVLVGAPVLVNPLLGAASVVLIRRVAEELFDRFTARRAALFALTSPFMLWMSSEAMNHASSLFFTALALFTTLRVLRGGSIGVALVAGASWGFQILIRPISALALGAPFALLLLHALVKERARRPAILALIAASAVVASFLLVWNEITNGDPFTMGYVVRWGPTHTLGFHPSPWGEAHTPLRGVDHTLSSLVATNLFVLGPAIPALALFLLGTWRARAMPFVQALAVGPVAILAVYFFYFFHDLTFGPRYLYEANVAFFVLGAVGLRELAPTLSMRPTVRPTLAAVAVVIGLVTFLPRLAREYHDGFCPRGGIAERAYAAIEGDAIVFVRDAYERAFFDVRPDLSGRLLFARDLGDEADRAILDAFPDRRAYVEDGRGFRALAPTDPP